MLPVNLEAFDLIIVGDGNDLSLKLHPPERREFVFPCPVLQSDVLLLGGIAKPGRMGNERINLCSENTVIHAALNSSLNGCPVRERVGGGEEVAKPQDS
ncbi:MAG TPA: hypothetical protein V6C84_00750 [Coleofasciculaceae cyanobacterium]|jgi:hypothetical protein